MSFLPNIQNNRSSNDLLNNDLKRQYRKNLPKGNDSKRMDEILGTHIVQTPPQYSNQQIQDTFQRIPSGTQSEQNLHKMNDGKQIQIEQSFTDQSEITMKLDQMEKMNRFLVEMIENNDKKNQVQIRKLTMQIENDRDLRGQMLQTVKYGQDEGNLIQKDLLHKISMMEQRLEHSEQNRLELRDKIQHSESNQKELLGLLKNLQKSESTELLNMRELIHEKLNEDHFSLNKEREKSKALFHELVRLGEKFEKNQEKLDTVHMEYQTRIKHLEEASKSEYNQLQRVVDAGGSNLQNIANWNDKLEQRVQQLEGQHFNNQREQQRDRDTIQKLEQLNHKLTHEIQEILLNLQNENNQRLELKVTELVTRIVMEHEERVRTQEDIKMQMDMKDKLIDDKHNYDREEMRDRYNNMDKLVRAEFMRKDEAINSLKKIMESNIKSLYTQIKQEENYRQQQHQVLRDDFISFQQIQQEDYDQFKSQQSLITEKITDMIKIEIESRQSSDVDLKNLLNSVASEIIMDVNVLKEEIEKQFKQLNTQIKDVSSENAEKCGQLSRYIDSEVEKVNLNIEKQNEKFKQIITKLAEQFKQHLLIYEGHKKEIYQNLSNLELKDKDIQAETSSNLNLLEMKLQDLIETEAKQIYKKINEDYSVHSDKLEKLSLQQEKDVQILKEFNQNNRVLFLEKMELMLKNIQTTHEQYDQNLLKQSKIIQFIRQAIRQLEESMENDKITIQKRLQSISSNVLSQLIQERALRSKQNEGLNKCLSEKLQNLNQTQNEIQAMIHKFQSTTSKKITSQDLSIKSLENSSISTQASVEDLRNNLDQERKEIAQVNATLSSELYLDRIFNNEEQQSHKEQIQKTNIEITNQFQNIQQYIQNNDEQLTKLQDQLKIMKEKTQKDINFIFDQRVQELLEKQKEQNHNEWIESVKKAQDGFGTLDNYKYLDLIMNRHNIDEDRLQDLVYLNDQYQRPYMKKIQ